MTPEGKVKAKGVEIFKRYNAWYFFPAQNGYGAAGTFDIVIVLNGYFLGVECKADDKKHPTALQSRNAAKAIAAGGTALLIHKGNVQVLESTLRGMQDAEFPRVSWSSVWPFDGVIQSQL
jgi:hypothetical protein